MPQISHRSQLWLRDQGRAASSPPALKADDGCHVALAAAIAAESADAGAATSASNSDSTFAVEHRPVRSVIPPSELAHDPAAAPPPPLAACVLGSGSGGNCTVIRHGGDAMLIDAGFGPRTVAERLQQAGLQLADIRAVCLTHLDQDHFRPHWIRTLVAFDIRVYLHRWHVTHLNRCEDADALRRADLLRVFDDKPFEPLPGLRVRTVPLPHDDKGTSAFHLEAGAAAVLSPRSAPSGGRIGYATDLGHVPDALIDLFAGVDVLMLECNYDPRMQLTSSRPAFLKARVMGGHGHLSNEQSLQACRKIAGRSPQGNPQKIVLLHRSQQCNTNELVRRAFEQEPRFRGRFTIAQQHRRTPWFEVAALGAMARDQLGLSI